MMIVQQAPSLDVGESIFWMRVGTAVLCGAAIGVERQLRGKAAGVRTCILVCLGTEIFVALGETIVPAGVDASRVLGQVITGIGFLGAGVILAREGKLLGVTSAAVIWLLAALGATIGLGHLATGVVLTLVTLLVLIGVEALETAWMRMRGSKGEPTPFDHLELQ